MKFTATSFASFQLQFSDYGRMPNNSEFLDSKEQFSCSISKLIFQLCASARDFCFLASGSKNAVFHELSSFDLTYSAISYRKHSKYSGGKLEKSLHNCLSDSADAHCIYSAFRVRTSISMSHAKLLKDIAHSGELLPRELTLLVQ